MKVSSLNVATQTLMQLNLNAEVTKTILDFILDLNAKHDSRQSAALFLKTRVEKVYDVRSFDERCLIVSLK